VIIIEFFDAALLDQRKTFGRSIGHSLVRSRVGLASLSLFRAFISRSDWGYARRPALTEKRELTVKRSHHHKADGYTRADDEASKTPHVHVQEIYPVYAATTACQQSSY
jgi:hypothetical protein